MSAAQPPVSLGELAVRHGCELRGDPAIRVHAVATLRGANGELGFIANPAYVSELSGTGLSAVVIAPDLAARCPVAALIHRNPHATFARIAAELTATKEASAVLGIAGAVGALGGFLIPITFSSPWVDDPVAATRTAFVIFTCFYVVCLAVTWAVYLRPRAAMAKARV